MKFLLSLLFILPLSALAEPFEIVASGSDLARLLKRKEVVRSEPLFSAKEKARLTSLKGVSASYLGSRKIRLENEEAFLRLKIWIEKRELQIDLAPNRIPLLERRVLNSDSSSLNFENLVPTDAPGMEPFEPYQWGLSNPGFLWPIETGYLTTRDFPGRDGEDLRLEQKVGGKGVRVAVLDSGLDVTHPDFEGGLLSDLPEKKKECAALEAFNACLKKARRNKKKIKKCNEEHGGRDEDHNGYPLDCHGWNVTVEGNYKTSGVLGDSDIEDKIGHGTHTSGLIGARRNDVGILGVAPESVLIPVKVEDLRLKKDEMSVGFTDSVAKGVLYALHSGAKVINMSLAWPRHVDSKLMRETVGIAHANDVVIVASAGNDSSDAPVFPCAYENVICVGNHYPDGSLSVSSNYGNAVNLAAPGHHVLSTWPLNKRPASFPETMGYELANGTSFASPMVAGLVARLVERGMNPGEIRARLELGSRPHRVPHDFFSDHRAKFTQNGNVDFRKSLSLSPSSHIVVSEKTPELAPWDGKSLRIPIKIELKNIWMGGESFEIEAQSATEDVSLSQVSWSVSSWLSGEVKELETELVLENLGIENEINLDLRVASSSRVRNLRVRYHVIVPVGPTFSRPGARSYAYSGPDLSKSSIRTVQELDGVNRFEYFAVERDGEKWTYRLLKQSKSSYALAAQTTVPSMGEYGTIFLRYVQRLDVDFDGESDYVLVHQLVKEEKGKRPKTFFQFSFYDRNLKPLLYSKESNIVLLDYSEAPLAEDYQWMKLKDRLVPAWLARALLPPYEKEKRKKKLDPWDILRSDYTELEFPEFRVYYLSPEGLRAVTDTEEDWTPTYLLPQSSRNRARGKIELMLAYREMSVLYYANAQISDAKTDQIKDFELSAYRSLVGLRNTHELLPLDRERSETTRLAISAPIGTRGKNRTTILGGGPSVDFVVSPRGPLNRVRKVIGVFEGRRGESLFAETTFDLQFFDSASGQSVVTGLRRYTFFPELMFSLLFFPAVVEAVDREERLPAVYIPSQVGSKLASEFLIADFSQAEQFVLRKPARLHFVGVAGCSDIAKLMKATPKEPQRMMFFCGNRFVSIPISI